MIESKRSKNQITRNFRKKDYIGSEGGKLEFIRNNQV